LHTATNNNPLLRNKTILNTQQINLPNSCNQSIALINLNKPTKILTTLNLNYNNNIQMNFNTSSTNNSILNKDSPILTTTKLSTSSISTPSNHKIILSSNLLTPIVTNTNILNTKHKEAKISINDEAQEEESNNILLDNEDHCSNESSSTSSSSTLDDSLTSLQWLQNLNFMKPAATGTEITSTTTTLLTNDSISSSTQSKNDAFLDTTSSESNQNLNNGINLHQNQNILLNYTPLTPPLSIQCSTSPPLSSCSSLISNQSTNTKLTNSNNTKKSTTDQTTTATSIKVLTAAANESNVSKIAQINNNNSNSLKLIPISNNQNNQLLLNNTTNSLYLKDKEQYRSNPMLKPPFSYSQLIILAMKESKQNKLTLQMIFDWIIENFVYFKKADPNWQVTFKNSIRHNLSLNKCFRKIARRKDEPGKGGFWTLDPNYDSSLNNALISPIPTSATTHSTSNLNSPSFNDSSSFNQKTGLKRKRNVNNKNNNNTNSNTIQQSINAVLQRSLSYAGHDNYNNNYSDEATDLKIDQEHDLKKLKHSSSLIVDSSSLTTLLTPLNNNAEAQYLNQSSLDINNHNYTHVNNNNKNNLSVASDLDSSISSVFMKTADSNWSEMNAKLNNQYKNDNSLNSNQQLVLLQPQFSTYHASNNNNNNQISQFINLTSPKLSNNNLNNTQITSNNNNNNSINQKNGKNSSNISYSFVNISNGMNNPIFFSLFENSKIKLTYNRDSKTFFSSISFIYFVTFFGLETSGHSLNK
jgi:hypothetical protein